MSIKQISCYIENKPGCLAELTKLIADNNINLRALSIADTLDLGILRAIVDDPDETVKIISDAGYLCKQTDVIAIEIGDKPGSMAQVLELFSREQINIEYAYAFTDQKIDTAKIVLRVSDNAKAEAALKSAGINILS